ncbi:heavy metal translocating P-type ATPase [Legionella shakespearei]|uniref:Cation transporting ATPase PacS n=1 Tax=Legionella shakespearei DSM 23087 TaxID=1122169 RepID=A0A0W0YSX4_9GAMM|nr:HAD-IC family P-type ATPase [Legionella shakespearei]KTD59980.1 cation transporting ATPase PacS [Legionella shakespearei DSM 23087]
MKEIQDDLTQMPENDSMSKPYVFFINGMSCSNCSGAIERVVRANNESISILSFNADFTTADPKRTTILIDEPSDTSEEARQVIWTKLRSLIEDVGFKCEDYDYMPGTIASASTTTTETQEEVNPTGFFENVLTLGQNLLTSHWFLGALGCGTGIAMLILFLTTGGLPLIAMLPLAGISTLLTLVLGARSYYEAWQKLIKTQTLTMDTLFAVSTISVLLVSIASFFVPWLPMMFEAGLLIYGFRHIGIAIEETIKEKISSARFQDRAPQKVLLYSKTGSKDIELSEVKPNDMIIISPGEIIPLDGYCEENSIIYNTIITGAILPRLFNKGEKVLAGMKVAEDAVPLKIRVSRTAKESYLARLDKGIADSLVEKAPLEIKTAQLLTYFIPTVIGLAVLSGVIIGIFFPPALAIQCAVSVLVSACPCTLGLIIPLAVKTGIHKGAEHGVQYKNAKVLQEAEQIDAVVFDLNGTLTTGIPVVKKWAVLDNTGFSPDQFLAHCAALESKSAHPVGKAIHSFAMKNSKETVVASKPNDSHHSGIFGQINNKDYTIGSGSLMRGIGVSLTEVEQIENMLGLEAGDSLVFLAREDKLIGYMVITDPLRDDAFQTVKALQEMGKEVHLCTGADEATAQRYAKALNIKNVYANAVATSLDLNDRSKPVYINELQKKGLKVAMVGDAANDAQAIAASDFGIAVLSQNSDELTQQNASAIIQNGTLLPIGSAFAISQQTVSNINQNLLLSLGYNLATVLVAGGLLLALGFTLNPGVGVLLMVMQACCILLNVWRFKEQSLPHLEGGVSPEIKASEELSSYQLMRQHTPKFSCDLEIGCCANETTEAQPNATPSLWNSLVLPEQQAPSVAQNMNPFQAPC